jgi:hypothetical protein
MRMSVISTELLRYCGYPLRLLLATARFHVLLCAALTSWGCSIVFGDDFNVEPRLDRGDAELKDVAANDASVNDSVDVRGDISRDVDGTSGDAKNSHDAIDTRHVLDARDVAVDAAAGDTSDITWSGGGDGGGSTPDSSMDTSEAGAAPIDAHPDPNDAGTGPVDAGADGRDAEFRPTMVTWSFGALGMPQHGAGSLELRGQFMSPAFVRGGKPEGITIEGRFR